MVNNDMNVLGLYAGHYSYDNESVSYSSYYYIAHSIRLNKPTTVSEFISFIKTLRTRALYFTDSFYITESRGIFADGFFEEETDPHIFSAMRANEHILGYGYINTHGNVTKGTFSKENILGDLGNRRIKYIKLFVEHPDRDPYMVQYKHVIVLEPSPKFRRERYGRLTYFDEKTPDNTFGSYEVDCLNNPIVENAIDWLRGRDDVSSEAIIAFTDKDFRSYEAWCFVTNYNTRVIVCDQNSVLISRYEKCPVEKMYMLYNKDDVAEFIIIKVDRLPTLFDTRTR